MLPAVNKKLKIILMIKLGWPKDSSLRKINRGLLLCCIALNGYVLFAPLWPNLTFAVQTNITKPVKLNAKDDSSLLTLDRTATQLIIPKLQLKESVYEGADESTLNKGIWRRPHTGKPGENNNTVLVGHRFTYKGQPPFYHLDKLAMGDRVVIVYEHKIYVYRIQGTQTVSPNESSVEALGSEPKLTIYTCTPLWTAKQRLVYTATLEKTL